MVEAVQFVHKPKDCALCLDAFEAGINVCLKLNCGHIFHRNCVEDWVRTKQNCPLCRNISVLSIPEPIQNVLNKVRRIFVQAFGLLVFFGGTILLTWFLPILILNSAYRVHQGLSFYPTHKEILKKVEEAYQHNLKIGFDYKPPFLGIGKLLSYSLLIIPCVLAGGVAFLIGTRLYFKNRIIRDVSSTVCINYIPPPIEKKEGAAP